VNHQMRFNLIQVVCISLVCLILVNRVVYRFGFQILFGEAFKCIHDKWYKYEIVGLCQGIGVLVEFWCFFFLVLAVLEFKVWGRLEMSFRFYVLKMDYIICLDPLFCK